MARTIKLGRSEKLIFIENLGALLNSGIPIIRALQIGLFQAKKPNIRRLYEFLISSLESGETFFRVAARLPKVFSVFDVALLEMGDATGQIGRSLDTIFAKEEREADLRRKIKQALIYPISVIGIALGMICTIMTYVIPKIEGMYKEANVNLPALTQALIDSSRFIRGNLPILLGGIGILVFSVIFVLRDRRVKKWFDLHVLRVYLFGNILQKKTLITFCEFLAILLHAGILINKALLIVKNGIGNVAYEDEIDAILEEIKSGKTLSGSLGGNLIEYKQSNLAIPANRNALDLAIRRNEFFPIELSTAVKIGEQTGMLGRMLERISIRYDKEVENIVKNLSAMLEPAIIMILGIVVGTMILAIMLPFFNMVNVIK